MKFIHDDGGRSAAGYKGSAGDCVTRSIAIALELPYKQVYDALNETKAAMRQTKRVRGSSSRTGVGRPIYERFLKAHGWKFVPTMAVGSGCRVHLTDGELPSGRIICRLSRHLVTVVDGVIHDTHDPSREVHVVEPDRGQELKPGQWRNANGVCSIQRRCVYGYFIAEARNV